MSSEGAGEMSQENNEKSVLVPRLRFPEFRNAEGWKERKLIDVADREIKWSFVGGPFGSNLKSSDYVTDGVRVIQLQNIGDGEFIDDYKIFTSEEKADELLSNNIYPHEIILSKMGDPVGRACLIPESHLRYVMCSDGIRLAVNERKYSKYFVFSLINSSPFRALVEKTATGSTRKRIGIDELRDLPFFAPENDEQQKIADCLSSLDELITAETQKLDALKTHKKGLMQQLFPREGETVPRLRFPEFREAGEWEENTLEQVATYENGKAHEKSISDNGKYVVVNSKFISTEGEIRKYSNDGFCFAENGDILMVLSDVPNGRAIAKCYLVDADELYTVNQRICRIKATCAYGKFLFHILDRSPYFLAFDDGVKQTNLRKEDVLGCPILLPQLVAEQQKIADCLSSLDDLITAQTQKIDVLKTHKKGLIQQLFPVLDEVPA